MIKRLNNNIISTAKQIRTVFQHSYAVEAALLQVEDFPPLRRPLESYLNSKTEFYGFVKNEQIRAIIEIENVETSTEIHSLVVDPTFFRQGLAQKLINFIFKTSTAQVFYVETGLDNQPAIRLYEKLGFVAIEQWRTEEGIAKIRFERKVKE